MVDVDVLYRFIRYIIKKESTGHLSPDEYNRLLPRGVEDFFNYEYGLPQDYKPGKPLPDVAWEITQKISDDLRPLKTIIENHPVTTGARSGEAAIPSDYVHYASHVYWQRDGTCSNENPCPRRIEIFPEDIFWDRVCHPNKAPTLKKPIGVYYADHIKLFPNTMDVIQLVYLRYPKTPFRDYTIVSDDDVYADNAGGVAVQAGGPTQQIELPEIITNQIARIILSYIGINLREQMLLQYAEMIKAKGI